MPATLTRQALYDLVWSRPRSAIAKELDVSDLAVRSSCARANVPLPPAGFFARVTAGGNSRRPALPMRLPGQSESVLLCTDTKKHWYAAGRQSGLPQVPTFVEDLGLQVADARRRIGRVVAARDLLSPDPALARVLASEGRRRDKFKNQGWSFDKPHFDDPVHQRQLRLFNSLARSLGALYGRQEVRGQDEWIQGVGTLHHLVLHLNFGDVRMELNIHEPMSELRGRGKRKVAATTLSVGGTNSLVGVQEWSDGGGRRLEDQLTDIAVQLLERAERSLRAHAQWKYEQQAKQHAEELAAQEARRQKEEAERLAAIEARRVKVRDEIVELARSRRVAEGIRAAVAALRDHPGLSGVEGEKLAVWSQHALIVADSMDPMRWSVDAIVGSLDVPTTCQNLMEAER